MFLGLSGKSFSQQTSTANPLPALSKGLHFAPLYNFTSSSIAFMPIKMSNTPVNDIPAIRRIVSPDFYLHTFGFFCKNEFRLQKATGIPLRFRLGSIDYCNKLEQKQR